MADGRITKRTVDSLKAAKSDYVRWDADFKRFWRPRATVGCKILRCSLSHGRAKHSTSKNYDRNLRQADGRTSACCGGKEELRSSDIADRITGDEIRRQLADDGGDHGIQVRDLIVQFEVAASQRLEADAIGGIQVPIRGQIWAPRSQRPDELHAGQTAELIPKATPGDVLNLVHELVEKGASLRGLGPAIETGGAEGPHGPSCAGHGRRDGARLYP